MHMQALRRLRARLGDRAIIAGLLFLGVAMRAAWNALRPTGGASGEAMNVAIAIGEGRGFADAYQVGQGATAHLLPISPGIAGLVYQWLGVRTPAAEFILASWSIGLAMGTYLLVFRAFGRLGTPLIPRLGALALACLAPAYIGQEAVDFRVWEGGLAVFLAALFLDSLLAASQTPSTATRTILILSLLGALLFFVNPPMGIGAYACAALFALRRLSFKQTTIAAAVSVAVLAVLLTPWTLRNDRALGAPIVLRSNAGLELALANYPGATRDVDRKRQFLDRLGAIHPVNPSSYEIMRASGGEVAYARLLGEQARAWMGAHRGEVAALMARHMRQMLIPERWQFDVFGRTLSPALRSGITGLVGVGGLLGLALAIARRRPDWLYPAIQVGVVTLLISPFQPVTRYTYLIYPIMVFCAGDLIATLAARSRFRRKPGSAAA